MSVARRQRRGMLAVKRLLDIVIAGVVLLLAAPVIAVVAFIIRIRFGGPVFFRQERPGLHRKPFRMIKFRTMLDRFDADGRQLPDEARITPFGRFLRHSSLDELPELWNVLIGEMSLVGPRPLLMEYLPLYTRKQDRRHEVKPGVTGWAQVNGRNAISWERKFELDVWYVDHQSIWLDFRILLMSFWKVLNRHGVSQEGHATMPLFTGTKLDESDDSARRTKVQ